VLCTAAGPIVVMALARFHPNLGPGGILMALPLALAGWTVGIWISHHPFLMEVRNLLATLERGSFRQQMLGIGFRLRGR
jgi:hypothetical protein